MLPENIKKACELAKGPGKCKYVENNEPCCVIAQLYVLDGGDIEDLKPFQYNCVSIIIDEQFIKFNYSTYFLSKLQKEWDSPYGCETNEELLEFAEKLWKEMEEEYA